MEISSALALGRSLLREHGLEHWRVTTDHAKTRAGVCRFGTRTISLSGPLTRLHDESEVRDTLLHEIAHALVGPTHGHDDTWRSKAVQIGCSGQRTVDASSPQVDGPWRGECPGGHTYTRHRRPRRVLSCRTCHPEFDAGSILTWTYHGGRVDMGEAYREELEEIILRRGAGALRPAMQATSMPVSHTAFPIGALVRIVADGPLHGVVGEVEATFATRSQVRIDDELYAVPNEVLEVADRLAS
ncbi:SprT-like domain-containing protein [Knoellia sp. CPCC 206450]|uniref:SprT-like domain-containing protein n=1 Tax=Knoellia tibetensis TaxID=3404798 RepID=UPI003B42CA77